MNRELVKGIDFANVLNKYPEHRPVLVTLSSCQTAQGQAETNHSGIVNLLLKNGISAVIAMGWSKFDQYATAFAANLYKNISEKQPLHRAFKFALTHIRNLEAQQIKDQRKVEVLPAQWLIPQLYWRQPVFHLVEWVQAS